MGSEVFNKDKKYTQLERTFTPFVFIWRLGKEIWKENEKINQMIKDKGECVEGGLK